MVLVAVGGVVALSSVALWRKGDSRAADWTTSDAPPPTALSSELPANPTELLWQENAGAQEIRIVDDYVVEEHDHGVAVRDLSTGRERWHYFAPDGPVLDVDVVGGRITLSEHWFGQGPSPHRNILELDLSSGHRADDVGRSGSPGIDGEHQPLPIVRGFRRNVEARDANTGQLLWTWSGLPNACQVAGRPERPEIKSAEGIVAVGLDCGRTDEVAVLDAATGRARWHRPLGAKGRPLDADNDRVLVITDTPPGHPTVDVLDAANGEPVARSRLDGDIAPAAGEFVDSGWCAVTDHELACYDESGETLWGPTEVHFIADAPWVSASSGPRLVLTHGHGGLLQIYAPGDSSPLVGEVQLPDWLGLVELTYRPGVLAVSDSSGIAVYGNPE
jgi:hypothetical protein